MKCTTIVIAMLFAFVALGQQEGNPSIVIKDSQDSIHTSIGDESFSIAHKDLAINYLYKGMEAGNRGEFEKAIELLTTALLYDLQNPDIYYNLGLAEFHLGNKQASIDRFTECIALDPTNADAVSQRGVAYAQLSRWEESEEDFIKLAGYSEHSARGYYQLGILFLSQSDYEKCCDMLQKAMELEHPGARDMINKYCD